MSLRKSTEEFVKLFFNYIDSILFKGNEPMVSYHTFNFISQNKNFILIVMLRENCQWCKLLKP